jgi:hypothetical protein
MIKIKVVVVDEHTLGFLNPIYKNHIEIFHSSILKGSPYPKFGSFLVCKLNKIRLATKIDFDEYRIHSFEIYNRFPEYEFNRENDEKIYLETEF